MAGEGDWRLNGQEKYLYGVELYYRKWIQQKEDWDHDHCEFCWGKFMEEASPDTMQEGYATEDGYRWICKDCFEDFKDKFCWKVK